MPVPPLRHRTLDAGEQRVALRPEKRHGKREVIDEMQHRHGGDEAQEEPVRDVNVRFLPTF